MSQGKRFSRVQFKVDGGDCNLWPPVDADLIPEDLRSDARSRVNAIKAYLNEDASVEEVEEKYGVHRSTLYRMIKRCESRDDDGRVLGFKGAIPYWRNSADKYNRLKAIEQQVDSEERGDAGVFQQLIDEHIALREWLGAQARKYKPRKEGGEHFAVLHSAFLALCASLEIPDTKYPFCRKTKARSALRSHLIKTAKTLKSQSEADYNESRVRDIVPPTDIMEDVEADGHEVDIRLVIEETDRYGQPVRYEILRIWLITLIDVFSRCVLGYSIALGRNYDQIDLLSAVYNSMAPHRRPPLCIPETSYMMGGGFPSEEGCAWETWSTLKLDNAWAHRAKHVLTVLQDRVGCVAEFGRVHVPNDRPFIERFFRFLTEHFSHRVIGTTGSNSLDKIIERLSPKSKDPLKLLITLDELHSALDIVLSDYNGRQHSSLQGHTPLDIFHLRMSARAMPANSLPEEFQNADEFVMVREKVVIKSSSKYGGAYVNFAYLKYRNAEILRSDSTGRTMFIEYSRTDISIVRLLDEAGSLVGMLIPPDPWSRTPHSLKLRLELCKAIKDGQLKFEGNETVHDAFRRSKVAGEGVSRSVATTLFKQSGRVFKDSAPPLSSNHEEDTDTRVKPPRLTKVFTF
jgi:transposase InsO family protein/transposase-like protein